MTDTDTCATQECTKCGIGRALEDFYPGFRRCKPCILEDRRRYYRENREAVIDRVTLYRQSGRPAELRAQNIDEVRRKAREAARARQPQRTEYMRRRRQEDPLFRAAGSMRSRLAEIIRLNGWTKGSALTDALGCSFDELRAHIQGQFRDGMCWENYGDWHLDHIVPLCSAVSGEDLYALNHFSNLQPLWARENIQKRHDLDTLYKP